MNLAGMVGMMGKRANGDWYIVGASDKANKAFSEKMRNNTFHISEEQLRNSVDAIEIGAVKRIDNVDEWLESKITGMPHCFGDSYGYKVRGEIQTAVAEYCDGEMSDEDIKQTLIDACKDMRVYHAQCWHTTGENVEDNTQIIEQVYELFQKTNVRNMVGKCFEDGNEIADKWGGREKNWVYYDSKYNGKAEHLREVLQEASREIASEWGIGSIDFEKVESESKYTLDGDLDFNSVWNWRANQRGICNMNPDWKPQEDFSLFYQEFKNKTTSGKNTLDDQAGICIVKYGGKEWTMEVPFNNSLSRGEIREHFNAGSLFADNYGRVDESLLEYMGKFELYTRFYGHKKVMRGDPM